MSKEEALLLLLISIGAFVMPFLARRTSIPTAVSELLYGMVVGGFIHFDPHAMGIVNFLAELGFIVLMYMAGLELDAEDLQKTSGKTLTIFIFHYLALSVFSIIFVSLLNLPGYFNIFVLITSIGLLFPILSEMNMMETRFGKEILILGSIGEVFSLIVLTGFSVFYNYGIGAAGLIHIFKVALFCGAAFMILKVLQILVWWFPDKLAFMSETGDASEKGLRGNFLNMLIFVALAAFLNIEVIIGAFIGGILFAAVFKDRDKIQEGFEMIGYGFLIPIFFIYVGINFEVSLIADIAVIKYSAILCLLIIVSRLFASFVFLFADYRLNNIPLFPLSTSFSLTLLIAAAKLGESFGVFSDKVSGGVILASVFSALIFPVIFKFIAKNVPLKMN